MDHGAVINMVEATIRPVFPRTHLENMPKFFTYILQPDSGGDAVQTIRPSVGQLWSLNYVQMMSTTADGHAADTMTISLINSVTSTTVVIEKDVSGTNWKQISFGSFGNGPLILTHDFYLEVRAAAPTHSAGQILVHVAASVSEV